MLKKEVKTLPCTNIPHSTTYMIVETDPSELGFSGMLKQGLLGHTKETFVRYYLNIWTRLQRNYSKIKKEVLFMVPYISKYQDSLYNKQFLPRIDFKYVEFSRSIPPSWTGNVSMAL